MELALIFAHLTMESSTVSMPTNSICRTAKKLGSPLTKICLPLLTPIFCFFVVLCGMADRLGEAAALSCQAAQCVNLVFDGDSISAGAGASPGHGLDGQVVAAIGDDVRLHNVAVGGRPVSDCLRLYDQRVAPLFDASTRHNVIAFHAGDNDIAQGRSADQTYVAFSAYVAAAHRQGWKVVVTTELRHADFSPLMEMKLEDYNNLIRRNQAGADAVVDLDADPRLRDFSHRAEADLFTRDGIHPSDGGYAVAAGMLAPQVKQIVGR
jgi:lysophospholipase L1-like esterase